MTTKFIISSSNDDVSTVSTQPRTHASPLSSTNVLLYWYHSYKTLTQWQQSRNSNHHITFALDFFIKSDVFVALLLIVSTSSPQRNSLQDTISATVTEVAPIKYIPTALNMDAICFWYFSVTDFGVWDDRRVRVRVKHLELKLGIGYRVRVKEGLGLGYVRV